MNKYLHEIIDSLRNWEEPLYISVVAIVLVTCNLSGFDQGPLLLTRFNFNPSMDEWLHNYKVKDVINCPFLGMDV